MSPPSGQDVPLSHAEIWDDSTLIRVWDDALREYKTYHSTSRRTTKDETGQDIVPKSAAVEVEMEDVDATILSESVEQKDNRNQSQIPQLSPKQPEAGEPKPDELDETGDAEISNFHQEQQSALHPPVQHQLATSSKDTEGLPSQTSPMPPPPPPISPTQFPQHLVGAENEALRNLMISWYFAGYYTGFYEGQRQQQQQK